MAITLVTEIANMSLSRLSAKRLVYTGTTETDLDANTTLEAIQCNLHYEQTRDSLLESNWWAFARKRVKLTLDTESPPFEWTYQYNLPEDYLRKISIYENRVSKLNLYSYDVEGDKLMTKDTQVLLKYIRKVTDITEFTPLFIELLVLRLAKKLQPGLVGTKSAQFVKDLNDELRFVEINVITKDKQDTNTTGQYDLGTWNDARFG